MRNHDTNLIWLTWLLMMLVFVGVLAAAIAYAGEPAQPPAPQSVEVLTERRGRLIAEREAALAVLQLRTYQIQDVDNQLRALQAKAEMEKKSKEPDK